MTKKVVAVILILSLLMGAVALRAAAQGNLPVNNYDELVALAASYPDSVLFDEDEGIISILPGTVILLSGTIEIPEEESITITGSSEGGGVIERTGDFKDEMIRVPANT